MRIEGIGLVLILISVLFQLIQNEVSSIQQDVNLFQLHEKLDAIWTVMEKQYYDDHPETNRYMSISMQGFSDNWKRYEEQIEETKRLQEQQEFYGKIYIWIFLIGTVLLIIPKFMNERT